MDPQTSVITNPSSKSRTFFAKEKTDFGRGRSSLVVRDLPEKALSPIRVVNRLIKGSVKLGCPDHLFCSERSEPYKRSDMICKEIVQVMTVAGIDTTKYRAYSLRHALVNELYHANLDEKQVNAHTDHSNNAHTTLRFYYHLDSEWVGSKLTAV
jgi:site-specific recombinase XerD